MALKNSKSPGMDGINAEMLKAGGKFIQLMCGLCNQVWESDVTPND